MINVEVRYNDKNEELYCIYDKTRIEIGEKFAYLIIENLDMEIEKIPYHLINLPAEEDYNEDFQDDIL
jgi:hypothetical protein